MYNLLIAKLNLFLSQTFCNGKSAQSSLGCFGSGWQGIMGDEAKPQMDAPLKEKSSYATFASANVQYFTCFVGWYWLLADPVRPR